MNVTLERVTMAFARLTDSSKEYPIYSVIAGEAGLQEKRAKCVVRALRCDLVNVAGETWLWVLMGPIFLPVHLNRELLGFPQAGKHFSFLIFKHFHPDSISMH